MIVQFFPNISFNKILRATVLMDCNEIEYGYFFKFHNYFCPNQSS